MLLITIWQFDVGILYFYDFLPKETILFLFKFLRLGPTFAIPIMLFVAYTIMKDQPAVFKKSNWLTTVTHTLFTKKAVVFLSLWSGVIYFINWTNLGIEGLKVESTTFSSVYYFPEYGPLSWMYIIHMSSYLAFLLLILLISNNILNSNFRNFLRAFYINSLWLVAPGFLNFSPETGVITSSIGVVIFSTTIVHAFIKLNINVKSHYYQLMERQKKLDYTGNLAGSLIHEVKNTNQIIKSFSGILGKSDNLSERDKRTLEMVTMSSDHLLELTNNYKKYMNSSNIDLKEEDLDLVIQQAIGFSSEILRESQVEINFDNYYRPLNAFTNKTNMEQVFINLIKNSIEAMSENNNEKKITIRTELNENQIIIDFIDTGRGIPPANWESVFDPFISLGNDRGMGFGLPFVKKTIIEHLGNIKIANSSPEGTHFQIELPLNGILNN